VKLIIKFLDTIKFWNLLPKNYLTSTAGARVCHIFGGNLCLKFVDGSIFNQTEAIDDPSSLSMALGNIPSGASAYNYIHYG